MRVEFRIRNIGSGGNDMDFEIVAGFSGSRRSANMMTAVSAPPFLGCLGRGSLIKDVQAEEPTVCSLIVHKPINQLQRQGELKNSND